MQTHKKVSNKTRILHFVVVHFVLFHHLCSKSKLSVFAHFLHSRLLLGAQG